MSRPGAAISPQAGRLGSCPCRSLSADSLDIQTFPVLTGRRLAAPAGSLAPLSRKAGSRGAGGRLSYGMDGHDEKEFRITDTLWRPSRGAWAESGRRGGAAGGMPGESQESFRKDCGWKGSCPATAPGGQQKTLCVPAGHSPVAALPGPRAMPPKDVHNMDSLGKRGAVAGRRPPWPEGAGLRARGVATRAWLACADACRCRGQIKNPYSSLALLDDDGKGIHIVETLLPPARERRGSRDLA
jgi:hypothetical protein